MTPVQSLLDYGALPDLADGEGVTAASVAQQSGDPDLLALMPAEAAEPAAEGAAGAPAAEPAAQQTPPAAAMPPLLNP